MKELTAPQSAQTTRMAILLRVVLPLALVIVVGIAGFLAYRTWGPGQDALRADQIAALQAEQAEALADEWGIRIQHVAPLADGGLLELRFQVVDPDKVIFMFDDIDFIPKMVDEDTGTLIEINNLPHSHDVPAGLSEFIIYRNVGGSVMPGDLVTVMVSDLKLEHFKVLGE